MSRSSRIQARFARRHRTRRVTASIYVLSYLLYLGWRATIFSDQSMTMSVLFYIADCIGFVLGLVYVLTAWEYRHRDPVPPPPGMRVAVLVPTFHEPIEVIRRTLRAAAAIDYPHETLVLDDAGRDEVRAIADGFGIRYCCRGNNRHAKAGNLNFGLTRTDADYVCVFDADHVPQRQSLDLLLGFLAADEKVALVQTPQDYYNTDAIQYVSAAGGALWHDQSFFYDISQPSRDAWNAASCVGTGVAYRRSALESIGGVPEDTVTEDMHTSMRLHKQGWACVCLNESVAYGIAAADLAEYYKTRHRWAHGNLHVLVREQVLSAPGLTFRQRLGYLSLGLIYLEGWQQLILFIVPVMALVFGLPPFEITIFNVTVVLLFPVLSYLLLQEMGCGYARFWTNEIFAMARFPVQLRAAAALLGRRTPWRSSAKNVAGTLNWHLLTPQITVAVLGLAAVLFGLWRLYPEFEAGPIYYFLVAPLQILISGQADGVLVEWDAVLAHGYTVDLFIIAGFWALYNVARAVYFMVLAARRAGASSAEFRFPLQFPLYMHGFDAPCITRWVSEGALSFACCEAAETGRIPLGRVLGKLLLPGGELTVSMNVAAAPEGGFVAALDWAHAADSDRLADVLYSVDWHRECLRREAYFLTPLESLAALFTLEWQRPRAPAWSGACYRNATNSIAYAMARLDPSGDQPDRLVAFEYLPAGTELQLSVLQAGAGVRQVRCRITGSAAAGARIDRNLDGTPVHIYGIAAGAPDDAPQR